MKFLSLEFKKGKPNLPLKVEKAKVDEVLTKIAHHVGRKVGTFEILYPVQDETGSIAEWRETRFFVVIEEDSY